MQRTAEEFVHQVDGRGRWFVGDYQAADTFMATSGRLFTMADIREGAVITYAHKSSAKKAAQRWLERTLDEIDADIAAGPGCTCRGFGAYIDFNGSAFEVIACEAHPVPAGKHDKANAINEVERAAARLDGCLAALSDIRAILDPPDGRPVPDVLTVSTIRARMLALLGP